MKNNKGFTLIEAILAASLSALIMGSTIGFLLYFFNEKNRLESWSSGQLEMSMAAKAIERDIRNVVRLEPPEDLKVLEDTLYFGLSSIAPGDEPSICLNDANSSVVRYTTLLRSVRQEKSMRAWSETDSADKLTAADELRVSYENSEKTLFSDKNMPAEILVVDADRRFIRRYEVGSKTPHLGATKDPYDDQPRVDTAGMPITFNYVSVFLKLPKGITGTKTFKQSAVFVTGSDIYASETYYICLRKDGRHLIRYNALTKKEEILLVHDENSLKIVSLDLKYLATKKGLRVDPTNFVSSTLTDTGVCVNSIFVSLKGETPQGNDSTSKDMKTQIVRNRTIFATNLSSRRPASCTAVEE
jgi:type II secretory pathway component PulJ